MIHADDLQFDARWVRLREPSLRTMPTCESRAAPALRPSSRPIIPFPAAIVPTAAENG